MMLAWGKLVVALLSALSWPAVAAFAIWVLRPHLSQIVQRMRSMEGLGVKVALEEARENLAESTTGAGQLEEEASPGEHPFDASSQFIAAWKNLEGVIREAGAVQGISSKEAVTIMYLLKEKGVVDLPLVRSVQQLREVRNKFVQGLERFDIAEMTSFVGLAEQIAGRLSPTIPHADA